MPDKYDFVVAYRKRKEEEARARQEADDEERQRAGKVVGAVVAKTWHKPMEGEPLWCAVREGD